MRLAKQQPPGDGVKDVRGDVGLPRLFRSGPSRQKHGVGIQVLQLQAPVAQHLQHLPFTFHTAPATTGLQIVCHTETNDEIEMHAKVNACLRSRSWLDTVPQLDTTQAGGTVHLCHHLLMPASLITPTRRAGCGLALA